MRLGLIARADDRGLGIMTWEFHRHLAPDRTLVVREPGAEGRGFPPHLDRYPDATVVGYADGLPEAEVRTWLQGLDVVYSAETFYDDRLPGWCTDAGVASVLHVMPEFYRGTPATVCWAPTPWRLDTLPADTRLVPVPIAADRFALTPPEPTDRLRVVHTVGHKAAADRNGTRLLLQALRGVTAPMDVRLSTQDRHLAAQRTSRSVTLHTEVGGRPDYWQLYTDADVLVLPRRYGGLSLPVQEAMASGLAVVLPDCPPNSWWPARLVPARRQGELNTPTGPVSMHYTDVRALGRALDHLATDRAALRTAQAAAVGWAEAHTWAALAPRYRAELARAADLAQTAASDF